MEKIELWRLLDQNLWTTSRTARFFECAASTIRLHVQQLTAEGRLQTVDFHGKNKIHLSLIHVADLNLLRPESVPASRRLPRATMSKKQLTKLLERETLTLEEVCEEAGVSQALVWQRVAVAAKRGESIGYAFEGGRLRIYHRSELALFGRKYARRG